MYGQERVPIAKSMAFGIHSGHVRLVVRGGLNGWRDVQRYRHIVCIKDGEDHAQAMIGSNSDEYISIVEAGVRAHLLVRTDGSLYLTGRGLKRS